MITQRRKPAFSPRTLAPFLAFLALASGVFFRGPVRAEPPNILFIFSDDHACQAIGAYGSRINRTPNIDRIASQGMRFDRCLVTNSICGPSRAVILTGKYSHLNGFRQNEDRFDGDQSTFPKMLQRAGYQTALFGKWHLGSKPTGFDSWEILPGQGHYYNPDLVTPEGTRRVEGYVTDLVTDHAIKWLGDERDPSRPFMLMVQHKAPHREWLPGPVHLDSFRTGNIEEPETLLDDYAGRAAVVAEQKMTIARHMRDGADLKLWRDEDRGTAQWKNSLGRMTNAQRESWERAYAAENEAFLAAKKNLSGDELVRWKYQRYIRDYLRCIQSVDDNVGRLLDWLESSGLADNTIVIYSSDQGFYLGEHGWYDKRWIFEESLRTPLLVRWPGVTTAGTTSDRLVSNLDLAATFLEMAGAAVPDDMQGRSLAPLLRGESSPDWREDFYYHYYELGTHNVAAHYGVVTDRYKLVRYYARLDGQGKPEAVEQWDLMDLVADPAELHSFVDDPRYQDTRARLERRLEEMRIELRVPRDGFPDTSR